MADELGVSQSYVAKYEVGERRLDVLEFVAVARALGADPADLVRELVDPSPAIPATTDAKPRRRSKKVSL